MNKKSVIQSIYFYILIFNIVFIVFLIGYYGYRTVHYYNLEHNSKNIVKTLSETISKDENIVYAGDGLYPDGDGYRFIGKNVNNYLYYSGMMWRIVKINDDKSITLITEENVSSLVWGYETNSFENSYINEWLNVKEGVENSGYFYNHLSNPDNYLVNENICVDVMKKAESKCDKTYSNKVGLISIKDYLAAGGTDSYLNTNSYFWTSNGSEANKVWYVFNKGGFNNLSSSGDNYYSYGVRPVITLNAKTALKSGSGTVDDPYIIEDFNYTKLNTTTAGQYITYNNLLWRIVDVDKDKTKVVLEDTLKSNDEVLKKAFSTTTNKYSIDEYNNIGYYLNHSYLNTLNSSDLVESLWYTGSYNTDTKFDYKNIYSSNVSARVGLLHMGELFMHDVTGYSTLTSSNDYEQTVITVNDEGMIYSELNDTEISIRPAIYLNGNMNITSGNGMKNNPFILGGIANE